METKAISAPWLLRISWEELLTLAVCLSLDVLEYIIPVLSMPLVGDIIDITGFIFCYMYFGWIGLVTLLEVIPGLDVIPIFTATWLVWYYYHRRRLRTVLDAELEKWK